MADYDWSAFAPQEHDWSIFNPRSDDASAEQPNDVGQSAATGLKNIVANNVGLIGNVPKAGQAAARFLLEKAGASPEFLSQFDQANANAAPYNVMSRVMPSSDTIKAALTPILGQDHAPQTTAGELAKTSVELAPMLAGPGGVVRKAVSFGGALAGNEAAKNNEYTKGNPYLETAATVAGSLPAWIGSKGSAARATIEDVKNAASAGYKSPEVGGLIFKPSVVDNLSNQISSDLRRAKANDKLAPQTHALVEDMKTPVNGVWHTYEDLQSTRELLEKQAANFANPQEQRAATIALKSLTRYIDNIPQAHLAAGNGPAASAVLQDARGNYAAAKTAERVADKIYNADVQAGSTYSGGNFNNAARQKLRPLLTSKKQGRGLTEDEAASVENSVTGSGLGNTMRAAGKFLGGGGGMQAFNSMGAGTVAGFFGGGPVGAAIGGIGLPTLGYVAKKVGDTITRNKAEDIVNQILERSPHVMGMGPPPTMVQKLMALPPPLRNALLSALMPASLPLQQARQPVQ